MLMVRASVGPSLIHGLGLFARERIPVGTVVWQFRPGFDVVLSGKVWRELSKEAFAQLRHYAYYVQEWNCFVLSSDDDRFTNHSDHPNTRCHGELETIATREIAKGEEVTASYREFLMLDFPVG